MSTDHVSRVLDETFGAEDGPSPIGFGSRGQSTEMDSAKAELLVEAVAEVGTRARRYLQEPAEGVWHDFVAALARTHGDNETYDLLRAVEIHSRTSKPR